MNCDTTEQHLTAALDLLAQVAYDLSSHTHCDKVLEQTLADINEFLLIMEEKYVK